MPSLSLRLDFRKGAPAVQAGSADHVPPGKYYMIVTKVPTDTDPKLKENRSSANKLMYSFTYKVGRGPETNKRVIDRMVWPEKADDSDLGPRKLWALMLACGMRPRTDAAFNFNPRQLLNKGFWAELGDNTLPARAGRPATVTSQIVEYILPQADGSTPDDEDEGDDDPDDEGDDADADDADDGDDLDDDVDDDLDDADDEEPVPPPTPVRARRAAAPVAEPEPASRRRRAAPEPVEAAPRRRQATAPATNDDDFPFAQN